MSEPVLEYQSQPVGRVSLLGRLSRHEWHIGHLIAAIVMMALGVVATFSEWADIFHIARRDEEANHIFLVPVVVAWLVWVRRKRFRYCQPRGMWLGPVLIGLGWMISAYGFYNGIQSFRHGGAVVLVVGCLIAVVGRQVLMRFLPAFVVLVFLVPIPGMMRQAIAIPLQTATAQVTQHLFELLAVPVDRSGNLLSINGQAVAIAEACNGLRMVFALVLVSYAFAFGEPLRGYVRVLILAATPLSAIACNVIRMLPTVWLYGNARIEIADKFHDIGGWIMLGIAFLLLMGIIRLLQWALLPVSRYTLASEG